MFIAIICDGARVGSSFLTSLHLEKTLLGLTQVWAPEILFSVLQALVTLCM